MITHLTLMSTEDAWRCTLSVPRTLKIRSNIAAAAAGAAAERGGGGEATGGRGPARPPLILPRPGDWVL